MEWAEASNDLPEYGKLVIIMNVTTGECGFGKYYEDVNRITKYSIRGRERKGSYKKTKWLKGDMTDYPPMSKIRTASVKKHEKED